MPADEPTADELPADKVAGLTRTVPGWTLRVGVLSAGVALLACLLAGHSQGPFDAVPAVLLLVLATAAPGGPLPGLFLLIAAATELVVGGGLAGNDSLLWRLPLAAALLHAVHTLCAFAAGVRVQARLEVAALRRPAQRWLLVQAVALPVTVGAAWLVVSGAGSSSTQAISRGWGILPVGLVAAAVVLLPLWLLRRDDDPGSGG